MIARIWHGKTKIEDFEVYSNFLEKVAVPDYQKTDGFQGFTFIRQIRDHEGHFTLITFWENLEAVVNFGGEDYEKAKYYPEDEGFLLEFEEKVQHHELFASSYQH